MKFDSKFDIGARVIVLHDRSDRPIVYTISGITFRNDGSNPEYELDGVDRDGCSRHRERTERYLGPAPERSAQ